MQNTQAQGSCLCGLIAFTLRFPSKWVVHCHCTRCEPGETHIAASLFTQALDRLPGSHVHYVTHVEWVTVAETLTVEPDS